MSTQVKIYKTAADLFHHSADKIASLVNEYVQSTGKCSFVLSGSSTPKNLYKILGNKSFQKNINWSNVYFFWGDERCVPPDNNLSNYKMAYDSFLSKIDIDETNIFRILAEKPHPKAAKDYENRLRKFFHNVKFPTFDVVLLGLGTDGHTASLFQGSAVLKEKKKWVVDNYVEKINSWRITMTLPVLNQAKNIVFLVSGKEKANAVKSVIKDKDKSIPASLIEPKDGNLIWCLDRDAAALIK